MARKTTTTPKEDTAKIKVETGAFVQPPIQETKQPFRVKQHLNLHTFVTVRNGFHGKLIYISPHTKEEFIWESFGDEQEMELQELKNAKSSSKTFFEKNWFLFDDPDVITYLGVDRYYADALTYEEFEDLFTWSAEEIETRIAKLSKGQKQSLAFIARLQIREGKIDSLKVIAALENSLGVELIEH